MLNLRFPWVLTATWGSRRSSFVCLLLPSAILYVNFWCFVSKPHKSHASAMQCCPSVFEWVKSLSRVRLFATPRTVGAYHASLSVGFARQEYWGGLPFPSPEDLPNPGIKPGSPACRQTFYSLNHQGSLSLRFKKKRHREIICSRPIASKSGLSLITKSRQLPICQVDITYGSNSRPFRCWLLSWSFYSCWEWVVVVCVNICFRSMFCYLLLRWLHL